MGKTDLAKRNGTVAKRETIIPVETGKRVWSSQGVLTRDTNGAKAYLRQSALTYLLDHVREGVVFTGRTIPMSESFGIGDFYVILSWLLDFGLVIKDGSRYAIPSHDRVRDTWNNHVDSMRL